MATVHRPSGSLNVDTILFDPKGNPKYFDPRSGVTITHNQVIGLPTTWDFDSGDDGFEIVNEDGLPLYQLQFRSSSHELLMLDGVFVEKGIKANQAVDICCRS